MNHTIRGLPVLPKLSVLMDALNDLWNVTSFVKAPLSPLVLWYLVLRPLVLH